VNKIHTFTHITPRALSMLAFSYPESPLSVDVCAYTDHKRLGDASKPKEKETEL